MTCNKPKIIKNLLRIMYVLKRVRRWDLFFQLSFSSIFFFLFSVLAGRELQMHDDSKTFIHSSPHLASPLIIVSLSSLSLSLSWQLMLSKFLLFSR